MTESDRQRFSSLLLGLAEGFGEPLSDPRLEFYYRALADFSIEQVEAAAVAISKTSRFFPKPVDFVDLIHGSPEDRAQKAWNVLCDAVDKIGWPKSLFVLDAAMGYAIEQTFGGWIQVNEVLGLLGPAEPMFASLHRTFCQNYRMAMTGSARTGGPRYFPSLCEANNRQNVSQWQDRPWPTLEDGTPVYQQHVGIITEGGQIIETQKQFSALSGALTTGSRRELIAMAQPRKELNQ